MGRIVSSPLIVSGQSQHYGSESRPRPDPIHRVGLTLTLLVVGWAELGSCFFRIVPGAAHLTYLIWPSIVCICVFIQISGWPALVVRIPSSFDLPRPSAVEQPPAAHVDTAMPVRARLACAS